MFIVATITYPLTQTKAVTTKWQKAVAAPLPSFLKRYNVLTTPGGDGIKALGIYEVADEKVGDGIKELIRYYVQFYDIEGFKYILETMMAGQESVSLLSR